MICLLIVDLVGKASKESEICRNLFLRIAFASASPTEVTEHDLEEGAEISLPKPGVYR